ncbi:guanosine polyphosphate pyrophosphohydrolase (plasmid) [Candidatus Megaera polyxenophila]|nr:guanosine polyphosphate pyrophosphohydrolase [Candidatus Megaera polyxenophila]
MNYLEPCQYSTRLIEKLESLDTKNVLDFDLINKAIYFARKYHGDQKRKSGEAYYTHPLEVAYMVSEYNLKTDVIVASILHDIIEDTEVTAGMIFDNFRWRIAEMVDKLTRDRPDGSKLSVQEVINNAYYKKDNEVLLIKLFDRLHNVQTIGSMSTEKTKKITDETLKKFITLSIYLGEKIFGILEIENKLIELCYQNIPVKQLQVQNQEMVFEDNFQLSFPNFQNDLFPKHILYLMEL